MSKAICKTCGGQVPFGHMPSEFDPLGAGHPAHELRPTLSEILNDQEAPYPMTQPNQSELEQARGLASVCTHAEILEHLNSWLNVDELHDQYHIKDEQIRIATLALDFAR